MLLNSVFNRFVQESPAAVMVRGLLEHVLTPESVDALFEEHADSQYTRALLFSQTVELMGQVVCGIYPSANAAYQKQRERFTVSRTAVYDKLNGVEPQVSAALTRQTAASLTAVIRELGARCRTYCPVTVSRSSTAIAWRKPNTACRNCGRSRRVRCPANRWWCWTRR